MKTLLSMSIMLALFSSAHAKTSLNSMCYRLDQAGSNMQGDRSEELFEIASVSKVVTSYWAIHELEPYFKFRTRIHITPLGKNIFDVHIQGSRDPFWGRELTHFLFSQLNKKGVHEIRQLSFDENLLFRWSVISDYIEPANPSPREITEAFKKHLANLANEYPQTRYEAAALGMILPKALSLKIQSVAYLPSTNFNKNLETVSYTLKSAPLYRYLKEMNSVSNNHVADQLFNYLGGVKKFKDFIQQDMNLDSRDIQFINGSGNPLPITNEKGELVKEYNKASCDSMVRVLVKMHQQLKIKFNMDLKDIMAVSGADEGTLKPRFDSIPNSMVAKTGTVDPAVTLAGMISTAQGEVYFGIFMGTESVADWNNARDKVRENVMGLINKFGGRRIMNYRASGFLPFDEESYLQKENLKMRPWVP
ncbi:MAG: D-alanyl-D-alanine carboxypeptidase [Pseudobdellovibrionaceae bacterium]